MSGSFPTNLPGLKINVTRKPIYSTKIQRSASGRELRVAWYATPLYEYTMEFDILRQGTLETGGSAFTELATITNFFNAQLGAWDSFNYTDPYDGTVRLCRFKEDSLEFQKIAQNRWELKKLALITVR
jgi:hypothetical protein